MKLENNETVIYVDNKPFIMCKGVFIDIPAEKVYLDIETYRIDELTEKSEQKT